MAKVALLALMGAISLPFFALWIRDLRARWSGWPKVKELAVGFVTNFFDTLGIGSFAPTTAIYRAFKMVDDREIPGTLNVGHLAPTIVEALIFVTIVDVDPITLWAMILAAAAGAWAGAGVVVTLPRQRIQLGMGVALMIAATLILLKQLEVIPVGGQALGLPLGLLVVAVACNFALGALMNLGIGLFGPCLILVALLGMNPKAAFPIMMGSCAFLQPAAGMRFITHKVYAPRAALGLGLGGVPAVVLAAYVVKSLPLTALFWLVMVVALYTSVGLLRAARAVENR